MTSGRTDLLNLVQPEGELRQLYGGDNYYWYLSSRPFVEAFTKPLAGYVNELDKPVLDVGCGEGILGDFCEVPHVGFDGSDSAIARGMKRNPRLDLRVGRIEHPEFLLPEEFGTIVFGGLLSVIVRPERYIEFIRLYEIFNPQFFIIYDLERVDTKEIDATFAKTAEYHGSAVMDLQPEVKKHRKILVYRWDK